MLIGVLTIGGGYACLPLIQQEIVYTNSWLTMSEFSELLAIAEITPGPIAINAATFAGGRVAGIPGAVCASLGFMFLPFVIVSAIFIIYNKYRSFALMRGIINGLKPASTALIACAGVTILILALWGEGGFAATETDFFQLALFASSLAILRKFRTNPVFVILVCGASGAVAELVRRLI